MDASQRRVQIFCPGRARARRIERQLRKARRRGACVSQRVVQACPLKLRLCRIDKPRRALLTCRNDLHLIVTLLPAVHIHASPPLSLTRQVCSLFSLPLLVLIQSASTACLYLSLLATWRLTSHSPWQLCCVRFSCRDGWIVAHPACKSACRRHR